MSAARGKPPQGLLWPERSCGETSIKVGVVVVDESPHFCSRLSWLRVCHNSLGQCGHIRAVRPLFRYPQARSCDALGAMHESFFDSDDKNEFRDLAIDRQAGL